MEEFVQGPSKNLDITGKKRCPIFWLDDGVRNELLLIYVVRVAFEALKKHLIEVQILT